MHFSKRVAPVALALILGSGAAGWQFAARAAEQKASNLTFTVAQAKAGQAIYEKQCLSCHGKNLDDGESPPLFGTAFMSKWGGKSVYEFFTHARTSMPASAPGSLKDEEYVDLLAYIFQTNTLLPGPQKLVSDPAAMKAMVFPAPSVFAGQLEPGIVLPGPKVPAANPLDKITPVTDAMLVNPPEGDWLTWRRNSGGLGYSPLKQINKTNVKNLTVAWGWSLPNGANESTPLVHDGVLFVFGYGDVVQALNATNGDLLWEYRDRSQLKGVPDMGGQGPLKKAIAIHGNRLYVPTSDSHIVALDVKTGSVVWDSPIDTGTMMTGGPLYAKGKIFIGTGGLRMDQTSKYRGAYVVALDAETGKEAWRFKTIPGPGEPGGDTWNGLPISQRTGASVWTPGSYDADTGLVYFGVAQTYDTMPLRSRNPGANNDGLYTDSTLAFDPDTGKLVWYYQHMPNDQWDLDWVFERQILTMPIDGQPRKVVLTAGKVAIHDVLDAKTGQYLFSVDPGMQNIITSIDPKTGAKYYNPDLIPGDGKTKFVCPHVEGSKNWIPSAINPESKTIFVPLDETCMYMTPVPAGEHGFLANVRISLSPRDGSDGLYGRIQAINLETKKTVWVDRQRAPRTSGVLATGGGLVFAGSLDRVLTAYDDSTGNKLWTMRMNEVLNSSPISYSVNGKQYIAVVLGLGGMHSKLYMPLTPEIKSPVNRSSSLWVFKLPDNNP